jgi:hypothetical protein
VDVLVPNVGVSVDSDVSAEVALTPTHPDSVGVIVAVDKVLLATPVTVTSPVALIATVPLDVAVPAQDQAES